MIEIATVFLKLGALAFGGPAAHIAMFDEEVVERRGWLDRQRFLDLLGATQLIPGPNSTEMAIHVGLLRGGWPGMLAAGLGFVLPAVVLSTFFAIGYVRLGSLPGFDAVLAGIKPVVVAIIVWALWRLGRQALKSPLIVTVAALAALASAVGYPPVTVLLVSGAAGMGAARSQRGAGGFGSGLLLALPGSASWATAALVTVAGVTLGGLALAFLQVGALLYGSGYVLVAFLQESLVQQRGWLSQQELLDAIAVGQLTPGPVLSTAAFIGYLVAGVPGAVVASAAIFLPSFLYVPLLHPLIPRLRRSPWASAFLDAVNAATVALIAVVAVQLARATLLSPAAWVLAGLSLLAVSRGVNSAWIVLVGAAGWLLL